MGGEGRGRGGEGRGGDGRGGEGRGEEGYLLTNTLFPLCSVRQVLL